MHNSSCISEVAGNIVCLHDQNPLFPRDTMATRNITLTILKNANALAHDLPGNGMWHCCSRSFETGLRGTYVYLLIEITPIACFVLTSEENELLTYVIFKNVSTSRAGGLRVNGLRRPNRNELLWVGSEIKAWSDGGIANKAVKILERCFGSQRVKNG